MSLKAFNVYTEAVKWVKGLRSNSVDGVILHQRLDPSPAGRTDGIDGTVGLEGSGDDD